LCTMVTLLQPVAVALQSICNTSEARRQQTGARYKLNAPSHCLLPLARMHVHVSWISVLTVGCILPIKTLWGTETRNCGSRLLRH
jgi:hypothetical protein